MPRGRPRKDGLVPTKGPNYGTAMRAIKLHCKDCCNGSAQEVALCTVYHCVLYPFRHGQMPDTARMKGKLVDPPKEDGK